VGEEGAEVVEAGPRKSMEIRLHLLGCGKVLEL
jgi:hypothetical protein